MRLPFTRSNSTVSTERHRHSRMPWEVVDSRNVEPVPMYDTDTDKCNDFHVVRASDTLLTSQYNLDLDTSAAQTREIGDGDGTPSTTRLNLKAALLTARSRLRHEAERIGYNVLLSEGWTVTLLRKPLPSPAQPLFRISVAYIGRPALVRTLIPPTPSIPSTPASESAPSPSPSPQAGPSTQLLASPTLHRHSSRRSSCVSPAPPFLELLQHWDQEIEQAYFPAPVPAAPAPPAPATETSDSGPAQGESAHAHSRGHGLRSRRWSLRIPKMLQISTPITLSPSKILGVHYILRRVNLGL